MTSKLYLNGALASALWKGKNHNCIKPLLVCMKRVNDHFHKEAPPMAHGRTMIKRSFSILLAVLCTLVTLSVAMSKPQRIALVIGNGAYAESPLRNPVNDAKDIAAALTRRGFEVSLIQNGTQPQIEDAIRDLSRKLADGGIGLFYYAGHGMQVEGQNYLIPVGAKIREELDVKYEGVAANRVLDFLERANNQMNIIILDACRNNPFARSFRSSTRGLARMDAPTGSIMAYATAPGSTASDGTGRNGVYTKHLLKAIETPGLDIHHAFMQVRRGVMLDTQNRQTPWESSSLIGDFYFQHPASETTPSDSGKTRELEEQLALMQQQVASLQKQSEQTAQIQTAPNRIVKSEHLALFGDPVVIQERFSKEAGEKMVISMAPIPYIGGRRVTQSDVLKLTAQTLNGLSDVVTVYAPMPRNERTMKYMADSTLTNRLWPSKKKAPDKETLKYIADQMRADLLFTYTAYATTSKNDRLVMFGYVYDRKSDTLHSHKKIAHVGTGDSKTRKVIKLLKGGIRESLASYKKCCFNK